jgi:hypothetical protein
MSAAIAAPEAAVMAAVMAAKVIVRKVVFIEASTYPLAPCSARSALREDSVRNHEAGGPSGRRKFDHFVEGLSGILS